MKKNILVEIKPKMKCILFSNHRQRMVIRYWLNALGRKHTWPKMSTDYRSNTSQCEARGSGLKKLSSQLAMISFQLYYTKFELGSLR